MRGYFTALMRSSGMAAGDRRAPAQAHVEPNAAERERYPDTMVTPAPAAPITSVPTPPPPTPVAAAPIRTVPLTREPLPQATAIDAAGSQPGADRPTEAHSSVAGTAARPTAVPEERTAETPQPPLGQELVRAAMRWVAAGTPHVPRVEPVESSHTRVVTEAREDEATVTRRMPDDRRVDPVPRQTSAMPSPASKPDAEPRAPVTIPALLSRPVQLASALPPVLAATPPNRDEIVEISIGSIHVRVDTPVTPAVAHRTVPPPPPVAPRIPAATTSRSALSRRALRRI